MMTEEIAALCRAMGAKEVQEELLLPLIQAVRDRLAGALKEGTAPEDCGGTRGEGACLSRRRSCCPPG